MNVRPRLVLAVSISPLEWRIRPQLEEWADVVALSRGTNLAGELDRLGWDACHVVGDESGALVALELAESAPGRVRGAAFGHAALYEPGARHHDIEPEIWEAYKSMARMDYRSFARALTQVTGGSYDDTIVDELVATVPQDHLTDGFHAFDDALDNGVDAERRMRALDVPLLLARHKNCLLWTKQGFDAAAAAFPEARAIVVDDKPSVSAQFAEALRDFCAT
jgi:pimeloyl-ACP methyl ester carboxylesterase